MYKHNMTRSYENPLYELLKDDPTKSIGEKLKGCVLSFGFGY
jgi:hypothetical protein